MKLKVFVCSLILGCLFAVSLYAENIPKEKLSEIREYPESLVQHVDKYDVHKLVKDDYFVRTLSKELKNKNTTAEEKVYIFYLMLQKIHWAFCGGIGVVLPDNYAHSSLYQCKVLYGYRQYLLKRNIDANQFFDLIYDNVEEKPILAAYSFLLGTLVTDDIEKSFEICRKAFYQKGLLDKPTWFRSMFIHNMMLMSPSLIDIPFDEPSLKEYELQYYSIVCQSIIEKCDLKEEEKEDLIIGIFYDDNLDDFGYHIVQCILNEKNEDNDCFILTCFILAQIRLNEANFKEFVELSLAKLEESEDDAWKKNLVERYIKANNYNVDYFKGFGSSKGVYNKTWDGISMIAYDDGILYCDDDYAEFEPITY